jgi:RluA family pseudouridine synthase
MDGHYLVFIQIAQVHLRIPRQDKDCGHWPAGASGGEEETVTIESKPVHIPPLTRGDGWLVVDKPAGITVHNAPGQDVCSLVSAVLRKEAGSSGPGDGKRDFRVSPVHRLDKETSGVLLLASTPETFRFFSQQFESRLVRKRYIAILHGRLADPKGDDAWGTWNWALAKTAGGRQHPVGTGRQQPAETLYRILDCSVHYTMVEIDLLSGRKHQIRRHAKLAGHTVVGDTRYGSKRAADYLRRNLAFCRLGLHAHSLTLQFPGGTGAETIVTPAIPDEMMDLFRNDGSL